VGVEYTYLLAKAILKPWLAVWFNWHIEGDENIPKSGPAILAFNHVAYLDPFASAFVVDSAKRRPRFLAKSELFADKRIAWILKGARQIEVRRGTKDAPMALDHAFESLDQGQLILVFPEGTVTTDPDLNPMPAKTGAARLAIRSGAPLIPCGIWGTANIWPKGYRKHWWPPGQDILIEVGRPLDLTDYSDNPDGWTAASKKLMDEIGVLVAGLRPAVPDRRRQKKTAA
jgi:1-acyl-sn-glycerol-3-phosphate acyltransferase